MTKTDIVIVKKALKILQNEFYESDIDDEYKQFLFIGGRKQAKSFYLNIKKTGVESKLLQDSKYDNVWTVQTEEINETSYEKLTALRRKIIETVKD